MADQNDPAGILDHIHKVDFMMTHVISHLRIRSKTHDESKCSDYEWPLFQRISPILSRMEYGGQEYQDLIAELRPAIQHHYAKNSHHPEHFQNGIDGMSLLDIIEMLCDWMAAHERHIQAAENPVSFEISLHRNSERFGLSEQLHSIVLNTARELGWLKE